MVQISGTNERFLQTPVVLSEVMRVMEPELKFIDLIPFVDTGGQPVVYGIKNSRSSDAKKQVPRMTTPSSRFAEVQITRLTKETAITKTEGLSVRFDSSALKLPAGRDMIMDGLSTVGYWIAENLNSSIYSTLDAGSTDSGITIPAVWSDAAATPMSDMLNFKNAMKREGYPYRLTDAFVHTNSLNEMEGYLLGSEIPAYREAVTGNTYQDAISLPMEGKPILHGCFSGVTDGDILGIDRRNPAAALYYNNDADYGTPETVSYETVVDGKTTTKTVRNFGLSAHKYFEDDTHDTVVQIWLDTVCKVKDAYGILSENGL